MGKKPQAPVETPVVETEVTEVVAEATEPQAPVETPVVETKGGGKITLKQAVYFKGKKHDKGAILEVTAEEKKTLLADWYE